MVNVAGDRDLVEVAVQLGLDNTARFERWIADGTVAYRHVGPITRAILQETLLPIVRDHKTQSAKEKTP